MRLFFHIFTVFFLFLPGFPELFRCRGGEKDSFIPTVSLQGSSPAKQRVLFLQSTESSRSHLFAGEVRSQIRNILQKNYSSYTACTLQPNKNFPRRSGAMLALTLKNGRRELYLPENFSLLYHDKTSLYKLVSLALLAASSLPLEKEKDLRNFWLTAAIVRKCLNKTFLPNMPYAEDHSSAMPLTSYGIYPDLKQLLTIPVPPEDTAGEIYSTYSAILLTFLEYKGLFSGDDFYALIKTAAEKGCKDQYKYLHLLLQKKLRKQKISLSGDLWFRQNIQRQFSNLLEPYSLHLLEKEYLAKSTVTGKDHTGKERSFPMTALADAVKELSDPDKSIFELLTSLRYLASVSPGNLRNSLLALRQHVIQLRKAPVKENQLLLNKAEQDFFRELENQLLMENFLRSAECLTLPPGTRFHKSLQALKNFHFQKENLPWGKRLDTFLRNTEKLYSDDAEKL